MKDKIIHKGRQVVHRLRQKPEKERRDLLHLLMIIACLFLFFLWTLSLGVFNSSPKEAKTKKTKTGLEPFSALRDNLVGGFESIGGNTDSSVE